MHLLIVVDITLMDKKSFLLINVIYYLNTTESCEVFILMRVPFRSRQNY